MSLRKKIIAVFLVIILPTIIIGGVAINQINQMGVPLERDLTRSSTELATSSKLDSLTGLIRYYDEVLTQAARNYALTQNFRWSRISTAERNI